jgi:type VI secretion system protein ImpL
MTNASEARTRRTGPWSTPLLLFSLVLAQAIRGEPARTYTPRQVKAEYKRIEDRFNRELAGRYPFASTQDADADPRDVCDFFDDNAGRIGALQAARDSGRSFLPRDFLGELNAAGAFLFANACSRHNNPVRVYFQPLPASSSGAEHIASWTLKGDRGRADFPHGFRDFDWSFGAPLDLELVWFDWSPWRPAPPTSRATYRTLGDKKASFGESGSWALMRLIEKHGGHLPEQGSSEVFLTFSLPVVSSTGDKQARSDSVLHLQIRLSFEGRAPEFPYKAAHGPEGNFEYKPLPWPGPFPREAPKID